MSIHLILKRQFNKQQLYKFIQKSALLIFHTGLAFQKRVDARLALLFKIYNGLIPVDARKYLRHPTRRSRHSHSYSFIPLSTSTSSHRLSFYPRTITQWNSLPQSFFENTNLTKFKQSVSSFNHSSVNQICTFFFVIFS